MNSRILDSVQNREQDNDSFAPLSDSGKQSLIKSPTIERPVSPKLRERDHARPRRPEAAREL